MNITILGNNGPYPDAGGACSGYLLRTHKTSLLLDCGSGVMSNLLRHMRVTQLQGIILTHLHSDHVSDLGVLKYALQVSKNRGETILPIPVWAAPDPKEQFALLSAPGYFQLIPIVEEMEIDIGDVKLSLSLMPHAIPSFAVRAQQRGKVFFYSSDTAPNDRLVSLMEKTDLAMLHAGMLASQAGTGSKNHLTALECGGISRQAGVKALLISHRLPETSESTLLDECRAEFPLAQFAQLNQVYEV